LGERCVIRITLRSWKIFHLVLDTVSSFLRGKIYASSDVKQEGDADADLLTTLSESAKKQ
jgi:hypothetical protein